MPRPRRWSAAVGPIDWCRQDWSERIGLESAVGEGEGEGSSRSPTSSSAATGDGWDWANARPGHPLWRSWRWLFQAEGSHTQNERPTNNFFRMKLEWLGRKCYDRLIGFISKQSDRVTQPSVWGKGVPARAWEGRMNGKGKGGRGKGEVEAKPAQRFRRGGLSADHVDHWRSLSPRHIRLHTQSTIHNLHPFLFLFRFFSLPLSLPPPLYGRS